MPRRTGIACLLLIVGLCLTASGPIERPWVASLRLAAPSKLADQPVHIRVAGLPKGEPITVTTEAVDAAAARWRGEARFRADASGVVDLDRDAPVTGTYSGADGMGLFWSMVPANGDDPDKHVFFRTAAEPGGFFEIRLAVRARGREIAHSVRRREWTIPGVTHRKLTLAADGVIGDLFLPPPEGAKSVAVLVFGGSEGGNFLRHDAALFASHGFPALSLAYFADTGLPSTLRDIPLEYFAAALNQLRTLSGPGVRRLVVMGYSRGAEVALLLAEHFPQLVDGAVLYSPNQYIWGSYPPGGAAWTRDGRPLAGRGPIPVDHVTARVLAIAGEDDNLWPAAISARSIASSVRGAVPPLIYPEAGHAVGTFPYQPTGIRFNHPLTGVRIELGGSRQADAAARRDGWPRVLAFLNLGSG
ncbi:acyl-CoA thioesterase/BAAT N-terminal domain-containing protein [Allorhizocola rhizosphaerae]|uniref:acyl-CoA thioesterase/BAAT N-terminal domain-containing protein n=1 Tax=Allorhizocola rhizosphaerae TaxID=1872709 RepID=UPI000E3C12C9|nr:acyl-CoA thioesterase/bile acid-CoA:amino acid N-acyltransferase family protein [Allorhizocola rhizosphaerae]